MSRFHINKHGVPAPCKAQAGKCPLGDNVIHCNSDFVYYNIYYINQ